MLRKWHDNYEHESKATDVATLAPSNKETFQKQKPS